jgi:hypothetical protein
MYLAGAFSRRQHMTTAQIHLTDLLPSLQHREESW